MIGPIKSKNFSYPQIFKQQPLPIYEESHIIKLLELRSVWTKMHNVHFVFIVKHDASPSQMSKMDYGC